MSLGCYGRYGAEPECCFCADKVCCQAETRAKLERWRKSLEKPKLEVDKVEHAVNLNKAGMQRWVEREKLKER